MRPDREPLGAGSYLAGTWVGVAVLLLCVLVGAVLGGIIGVGLGLVAGQGAGDAAQAAGKVCHEGWFDMVWTVDCGDRYATAYAGTFGLVGVMVGVVVGLSVGLVFGPRAGSGTMSAAQKKAAAETWFTQPHHA